MFKGTGLQYGVTGQVSSTIDNADSDNKTLALIGVATIALIIMLILAIFRAPLAAALPIVVISLVLLVSNAMPAIIGKAVSAFVVSTFFVPTLTALIGHAAWWPGHADRARVKGSEPPAEEPSELAGQPH